MSIFLYGSQFKDFNNKDDFVFKSFDVDRLDVSVFSDTDLSGTKNYKTESIKDIDKQDQLGSPKPENATVFAGASNISIQASTLTGAVLPLVFAMQVGFPGFGQPNHECMPCSVEPLPGCEENLDSRCKHCLMVGDTYKMVDRFTHTNACKKCIQSSGGVKEKDIKNCDKCQELKASLDNTSCDCADTKSVDEQKRDCLICVRTGRVNGKAVYEFKPCEGDANYACSAGGECVPLCGDVAGGDPDTGECKDLCKICRGRGPGVTPNCLTSKRCEHKEEECKPDTGLCKCKKNPRECPDDKPYFQEDPDFDKYCECFCTEAVAAQGLQPPRTTCDDGSGNWRFNTANCSCEQKCNPPADPANCEECRYDLFEGSYKIVSKCNRNPFVKEECKDGECVPKCPSPCDPLKCEKCMRDPLSVENKCIDQCKRMAGNFECDGLGNCCPVEPSINSIRVLADQCYDAMNLPGLLP